MVVYFCRLIQKRKLFTPYKWHTRARSTVMICKDKQKLVWSRAALSHIRHTTVFVQHSGLVGRRTVPAATLMWQADFFHSLKACQNINMALNCVPISLLLITNKELLNHKLVDNLEQYTKSHGQGCSNRCISIYTKIQNKEICSIVSPYLIALSSL